MQVEKAGSNGRNTWLERWGHTEEGRLKWASKYGEDSEEKAKWSEEWSERTDDTLSRKEVLECKKWCRDEKIGWEWTEKWGEFDLPYRKEKWCDKWQTELSSGES